MAETSIEKTYENADRSYPIHIRLQEATPRSLPAVDTRNIANTSRVRSNPLTSRHAAISSGQVVSSKPCHVCTKSNCPLVSHRLYVFPKRRKAGATAPTPGNSLRRSQSPPTDVLQLREILEIRTGKFDPFINLPIRERSRDNDLFQHFFKISAGRIVTATGRNPTQNMLTKTLLPLALEHKAICQGAILYAAAQVSNMAGEVAPDRTNLTTYNKAIRLLYESLTKEPQRFKDYFVLAAIGVAGFDLTYGRKDELRRHLDSMHRVISSVGGLAYLGLGGLAAHLVLWLDFFGSVMLNRPPLYSLPARPEINLPGPPEQYGSAFSEMLRKFQAETEAGLEYPQCEIENEAQINANVNYARLLKASLQTCRLTELLEYIASTSAPTSNRHLSASTPTSSPSNADKTARQIEYYTYKRNLTDQAFAHCNAFYHNPYNHRGPTGPSDLVHQLDRLHTMTLASTILELYILHNVGPTHGIFHHLSVELQRTLLRLDLAAFWSVDSEILVWIIFSVGPIMLERNGRAWFVGVGARCLEMWFCGDSSAGTGASTRMGRRMSTIRKHRQRQKQKEREREREREGEMEMEMDMDMDMENDTAPRDTGDSGAGGGEDLLPANYRHLIRKILKKHVWSEMFLERQFIGFCDGVRETFETNVTHVNVSMHTGGDDAFGFGGSGGSGGGGGGFGKGDGNGDGVGDRGNHIS